jgi:hypothetical protein
MMSDVNPENYAEFATADRAASVEAEPADGDRAHPEQQAHGGSMAPGLVDDTGHPVAEPPPAAPVGD